MIEMVIKLIVVKTLFNIDDSFTPILRNRVSTMIMAKAKKSGYCDKKDTFIGIADCKAPPIV